MTADADLATSVEAVVRSHDDVIALYRSGGTLDRVIDAGARGLGIVREGAPLVAVSRRDGELTVRIAVGTAESERAPSTARAIEQVVRARLLDHGENDVIVHLTIAHITRGEG